jgi:hypothetical protein
MWQREPLRVLFQLPNAALDPVHETENADPDHRRDDTDDIEWIVL